MDPVPSNQSVVYHHEPILPKYRDAADDGEMGRALLLLLLLFD
jgi:hypothetical protein